MRIVKITVSAPRSAALATPASLAEAVRSVAVPQDELVHVYADRLPTGLGMVIYLLVPRDEAAATACRLVLAAADSLDPSGWTLGAVRVWGPTGFS